MDSMTSGPFKSKVLAIVAQGQAQQQAFIAQLSDAERAAIGEPDAWSAKDHIAHNAAWIADAARVVGFAVRRETPTPSPDETEFNPQVFAQQQHQPWDVILGDTAAANAALSSALEACSEAELIDPAHFPWRKGHPLWFEASVSGYEHPVEHYGQFYLETGNMERAKAVRQAAVDTYRRIVGPSKTYGYMNYNLGCFYANNGEPGLALVALREAVAQVPSLRKWSQEDPELVPLHDNPAFQALVAETAEEGASTH